MTESSSSQHILDRMMERFLQALQPMQAALISIASSNSQNPSRNRSSSNPTHTTPETTHQVQKLQLEFPQFGGDPFLSYLKNYEENCLASGRPLEATELHEIQVLFGEWIGNRFWYSEQTSTVLNYYKEFSDWKRWMDCYQGEEDSQDFLAQIFIKGLKEEVGSRIPSPWPQTLVEALNVSISIEKELILLKQLNTCYEERHATEVFVEIPNVQSKGNCMVSDDRAQVVAESEEDGVFTVVPQLILKIIDEDSKRLIGIDAFKMPSNGIRNVYAKVTALGVFDERRRPIDATRVTTTKVRSAMFCANYLKFDPGGCDYSRKGIELGMEIMRLISSSSDVDCYFKIHYNDSAWYDLILVCNTLANQWLKIGHFLEQVIIRAHIIEVKYAGFCMGLTFGSFGINEVAAISHRMPIFAEVNENWFNSMFKCLGRYCYTPIYAFEKKNLLEFEEHRLAAYINCPEFQTTYMEWLSLSVTLSLDGFSVFITVTAKEVGIQQVHGINVGDVLNFHKWKDRMVLLDGWLALLPLKIPMILSTLWVFLQKGNEGKEMFGRWHNTGSGCINTTLSTYASSPSLTNSSAAQYPPVVAQRSGSETWFEVGLSETYTPTTDDIDYVLKFECVVVDADNGVFVGKVSTLSTSGVIPAPSPSPRGLIFVNGVDVDARLETEGCLSSLGTYIVLSYNILADVNASSDLYSYCPSWVLSWPYRRQNLLREIVGYWADIICLQEVQSNHFEEVFAPELDKCGYQAILKRKTNEFFTGSLHMIDSCATFFRRDRFSHVKKYEWEFNKAAQSLTDTMAPTTSQKTTLHRLVKDNVALIAVLEAKFGDHVHDSHRKRHLVCVANTNVNVQQDLKDVKLWQVHTLLKGLEKIALTGDIPMLVCGNFDAVPGSAPLALLSMGKLDHLHPNLAVDPMEIKSAQKRKINSNFHKEGMIYGGGHLGVHIFNTPTRSNEQIQKVVHHEDMVSLEGWSNDTTPWSDTTRHDQGKRESKKG